MYVVHFSSSDEVMSKLNNVFSGKTYVLQDEFSRQGVFLVKVTPLGANLALLEGREDEAFQRFIEEAKDWLYQWFEEIRR